MTKKQAVQYLYYEWYNGELPSNFTVDHTQYDDAIEFAMNHGYYYINAEI